MSYIASENPNIDKIQKKMETQQPTSEMYISVSLLASLSSSWNIPKQWVSKTELSLVM